MITFYIIIGVIAILLIINEGAAALTYGLNIIRGKRFEYLKSEIEIGDLNPLDWSILSLYGSTEMDGNYISNTRSLIFPYYVACNSHSVFYVVPRFSKAHYLIKKRFAELEATSTRRNRIIKP